MLVYGQIPLYALPENGYPLRGLLGSVAVAAEAAVINKNLNGSMYFVDTRSRPAPKDDEDMMLLLQLWLGVK